VPSRPSPIYDNTLANIADVFLRRGQFPHFTIAAISLLFLLSQKKSFLAQSRRDKKMLLASVFSLRPCVSARATLFFGRPPSPQADEIH
jgi:hypothetical protein